MRKRGRDRYDPRDADGERAAAARADIVEILAGTVQALLLQRGPRPSSDEALHPRPALNSAVSDQIRASE
jgi:hypothetical protein